MNSALQGWYVDPSTGTNLRFWSGSTWTDEVAPLPHEATHSGPIDLGPIDPRGSVAVDATAAAHHRQPDEPALSDPPVPAPAEDGSRAGELDPDLELTRLTRRELRSRRGREAAPDDTPKHLTPVAPSATVSIERWIDTVEELGIPAVTAPGEAEPVETVETEKDPGRTRRIVRISVLLGVLAVASSIAILTAGSL